MSLDISEVGSARLCDVCPLAYLPTARTVAGMLVIASLLCCSRLIRCAGYGTFGVWFSDLFNERRKQINWDRQNGRGVMLARNFLHRL
jgi:hypothetical protein